jgi:hypothetical protein
VNRNSQMWMPSHVIQLCSVEAVFHEALSHHEILVRLKLRLER